ncbi:MAG: glycosyltransferase family 2 protein [Steroidobacteraceae bacterium]
MPVHTAVIIPTLNEAESIGAVVAQIPRTVVHRILVADGGSTDATAQEALRAGAEIVRAGRGYGRACLAGTLAASDADVLVFMDGDGADDPNAIDGLVRPIAANTKDFVIGSRVRGNAAEGSMARHQRLAGRGLGLAVHLLYGVAYTDMCALRAIRRDVLLGLGMTEMTYGWNLEMQIRAARAKLRILEVPVNNRRRIGGTSKVAGSLRGSANAGARILGAFGRQILSPPPRVLDDEESRP